MVFAPYLQGDHAVPLEERPIDLLFFGSINPRRRALLDRIEALGLQVAMFDSPLYGPERDAFIAQAKAVVNMHFYPSSRFEQVRVSHCLSLGTPVISERTCRPHPRCSTTACSGSTTPIWRRFSHETSARRVASTSPHRGAGVSALPTRWSTTPT